MIGTSMILIFAIELDGNFKKKPNLVEFKIESTITSEFLVKRILFSSAIITVIDKTSRGWVSPVNSIDGLVLSSFFSMIKQGIFLREINTLYKAIFSIYIEKKAYRPSLVVPMTEY